MIERIKVNPVPSRAFRLVAKLPNALYALHAGWTLGRRFLMLLHTGRKSGQLRKTVVEVIRLDPEGDVYYVASGFGERAQWYRNLVATPECAVHVGPHRDLPRRARQLAREEAEAELIDYQRRHPKALKTLARIMGFRIDGGADDARALAEHVPVLAFGPPPDPEATCAGASPTRR